uniref:Microcin J25-processing protein McjB C-terminal domain-containing protein n=1 Tax=Thermosporothrix sp. COM3 TaxID=2490863 RepID=A0A455SJN0_9CHLR|nr:hypothetical protein KTC_00150 [Thermosporothrix sp. COM3]
MAFIELKPSVGFDAADGEGVLLESLQGTLYRLTPSATDILTLGLQVTTHEDLLIGLASRYDADRETLQQGIHALLHQLEQLDLLHSPDPPFTQPAFHSCFPYQHQPRRGSVPLEEDWDFLLTGVATPSSLPSFSWWQRLHAWQSAFTALRLLQGEEKAPSQWSERGWPGWSRAHQYLASLWPGAVAFATSSLPEIIHLARRELLFCHCLVRLIAPQALCVTRSVAFCAYLCRAGIPAHVTIGRDRFAKNERFEFHAWVEVDGVVVNDIPEVATGYSPLVRIPIVHPPSHAASRPLQAGKHTA